MSIISMILGFVSKIIAEVLTNVLQSPAREVSVETVEGPLDTVSTPVDDLYDQYKWVYDRSEGES